MIDVVLFAGGAIAAAAVAYGLHHANMKERTQRWSTVADALGDGVTHVGHGGTHRVIGVLDGLAFEARLRTEQVNKKTREYCDVTVRVPLPLPAGLSIHEVSPMGFLTARRSTRPKVFEQGGFVVRSGDVIGGHRLFARPRVREWLVSQILHGGRRNALVSNQIVRRGDDAEKADDIVRAIRSAVRTTQALVDAISWRPAEAVKLGLEGHPFVAFELEAPSTSEVPAAPTPEAEPGGRLIDRMMADLSAEGTSAEDGAFTLDREAAIRKLRASRVTGKEVFALELLRAAALRGASWIEATGDADDLWVRFDGEPFTRRELDEMFGAAFASQPDTRVQSLRHLALALEGALGFEPKWLTFESGEVTLRRTPTGGDAFEARAPASTGMVFHLKLRLLQRLGGDALAAPLDQIAHHARFMRARVEVRGEAVTAGPPTARFGGQIELDLRGPSAPVKVYMGFVADDGLGSHARAWLGRHQVWIETVQLPNAPEGLRVVVMGHDLDSDLSGKHLVKGEDYARIVSQLDAHVPDAIVALREEYEASHRVHRDVFDAMAWRLRRLCLRHLSWDHLRDVEAHEPGTAIHALVSARVWPGVDGKFRSLRALNRARQSMDLVPFTNIGAHGFGGYGRATQEAVAAAIGTRIAPHALDASLLDEDEETWLANVFGRSLVDRTQVLLDVAAGRGAGR